MFEKVTHETLTDDINKAKQEWEILDSSADFLLLKLNELSQSDNELTDNEIEIIEKQLEYHKKMAELKSDFDIKKSLMRNILRKQISTTLSQMNNQSIVDTDLLDLECKLEQWLFNDSRDIIDDKVNNTDLSVEWLTDGFLNWESLWKIDSTNNFINYFTLELLNNDILVDESRNNINDQVTFTSLSKAQIEKFIHNTVEYLVKNGLELPDNIEIDINNSFLSVDLLKIKTDILTSIEAEKQKAEELRLQEEREKNKEYLIWILEDLFSWNINSQWLDVLQRKFWYTWNLDNWENEWYVWLLNNYVNEWLIDQQYILGLYDNWNIAKIILLNYLEQDESFNYVEFIESFWLTEKVKEVVLRYSREKLNISSDIQDKVLLENLTLFLLTFIMIESSWYNVRNRAWASTADWYYQYLNANWKYNKDKSWSPWSFQTWLNRIKRFLSTEEFDSRFWEYNVVSNHVNERNMNPSDLSAENQTILFFLDIVENGKAIKSTMKAKDGSLKELKHYSDDMMKLILSERNSWALWRIYKLLHHTDPDEETIDVYEREKNKYYYWDKKYIAKNHY